MNLKINKLKFNSNFFKKEEIKKADIVVGIPSYNEADNIDFVVGQIDRGLSKYYPKLTSVIVNVDNNSADGTKKVFLDTKTDNPKIYITTRQGVAGKGHNFYNLFKYAMEVKARGVVVVDADLKSITPEWVRDLADPILKRNYDFITPVYARHEYDGSITNHIVFPLLYGLTGKNIRQPIGGDFSMSDKLVRHLMKQKWIATTKKYGIDIFLTLNAVFGKFKIGQTNLGAKIHKPSAPKLGPMFTQVATTLFTHLSKHKNEWAKDVKISSTRVFHKKAMQKPQGLSVDFKEIKTTALYLFSINRANLKKYLSPEVYAQVSRIYGDKKMAIKPKLWCKIVYDMFYAFDTGDINSQFAEAFKPLYFGRAASFIKHTLEMSYREAEREILEQAKVFYKNRKYLLDKYRK